MKGLASPLAGETLGIAAAVTYVLTPAAAVGDALNEVRPGVFYAGEPAPPNSTRARYEKLMFDLAAAWAACDPAGMAAVVAEDVRFSFPGDAYSGKKSMLAALGEFCEQARETSFFFPKDAFYIDIEKRRIAAELEFRTTEGGQQQVVRDVWIGSVRDDRFSVVKEYFDGRVGRLQALGALETEHSETFLTPWPARTPQWSGCELVFTLSPAEHCVEPD